MPGVFERLHQRHCAATVEHLSASHDHSPPGVYLEPELVVDDDRIRDEVRRLDHLVLAGALTGSPPDVKVIAFIGQDEAAVPDFEVRAAPPDE